MQSNKEVLVYKLQPRAFPIVWSKLLYGIQQAAPPTNSQTPEAYNNVLAMLISGRAQCFLAYEPGDPPNVLGFVISVIQSDTMTHDRYLFLYAMYGYQHMDEEVWDKIQDAIEAFAKANGCIRLVGFIRNKWVLEQCLRRGAKQDSAFLYKEL